MTPQIALDLSLDGIAVLSRAPDGPDRGKWYREGLVRLDAPDMAQRLRKLRARCAERVGDDFTSILIVPDSQILFTSIERDDRDPRVTIRSQLAARTPYPVEDLTFDYEVRGDRLQVAVVALETLLEAETFAADFGFRPVALVATPREASFSGIPEFGQTGIARDLLAGGRLSLDLGGQIIVTDPPPGRADPAPTEIGVRALAGQGPTPPESPRSFADFVAAPLPAKPDPPRASTPPEPPPRAGPEALAEAPHRPGPTAPSRPVPAPNAASPDRLEPAFSSRRKPASEIRHADPPASPALMPATAPEPGAAATAEPKPEPETPPRILRPPTDSPPDAPMRDAPAAPVPPPSVGPRRPAALAAIDAALRAPVTPPPSAAVGRLAKITGRLRPAAAGSPPKAVVPRASPMAADGALSEAQALALPGIGRGRTAPSARRSGGRLGLYLTLSLLGLLALVAAWAILFLPEGGPVDNAAPIVEPVVGGSADGSGPQPGSDGGAADLALLLPEAGSLADAGSVSDGSGLVSPPVPLPAPDAVSEDLSEGAEIALGLLPGDAREAAPLADLPPAAALPVSEDTADTSEPLESFDATGRFEGAPRLAALPEALDGSEIYLASIDPAVTDGDAIALPPGMPPGDAFAPQTVPAPAGTEFPTGTDGLVLPSASGALAPGGYRVVAGRPAVQPQPRPETGEALDAARAPEADAQRAELRRVLPVPRPGDAAERVERVAFSGLSREEITRSRPRQRPDAIEAVAAARSAAVAAAEAEASAAEAEQSAAVEAATAAAAASLARPAGLALAEPEGDASRYALAQSGRPNVRPRSVERDAARIVTARGESVAAPAPQAQAPAQSGPSQADASRQTVRSAGGSVTRAATESNAIRLREINLIGVYGRASDRRALVRLANGRYVKVQVGDQLDRGRVTAIGESEVVYQRGGRNVALRMPRT